MDKNRRCRILAMVLLLTTGACFGQARNSTLTILEDGRAKVHGRVEENVRRCEVDLQCFLRLRVDDKELWVVYDEGEGTPCPNDKAADVAIGLEPGTWIEALGAHEETKTHHYVVTCESPDFYVREIPY